MPDQISFTCGSFTGVIGAVVKYQGCILDEVVPAMEALRGKCDLRIIDFESSLPIDFTPDFLLIPGGSCDQAIHHEELLKMIRGVDSRTGMLAGICNGALILASAGVLKGRSCTHTAHPKYAPLPKFKELLEAAGPLFSGSAYVDEDVVISKHVITAKPWASNEFAKAILEKLDLPNH